jgi:hypothetical protein
MASNQYFPPKSLTRTLQQIVREIDPDWNTSTSNVLEFDFRDVGGRPFYANLASRFPQNHGG